MTSICNTLWLIVESVHEHLPAYSSFLCEGLFAWKLICESAIDELHPHTQRRPWTQNKLRWKNTCMFTTYRSNQILLSQEKKAKWKSSSPERKIEGLNDTFLQMEVHFCKALYSIHDTNKDINKTEIVKYSLLELYLLLRLNKVVFKDRCCFQTISVGHFLLNEQLS